MIITNIEINLIYSMQMLKFGKAGAKKPTDIEMNKVSAETKKLIKTKLKEKLKLTKDKVNIKKTEAVAKAKVEQEPKSEEVKQPFTPTPKGVFGDFSERVDPGDENFMKAKRTLVKLLEREGMNPRSTRATPRNHFHLSGYESFKQLPDTNERYNLQIDDPNSILHIANLQQNKDFENYTKIYTEDSKQILKVATPDVYSFFRLQHEMEEMKRKKDYFAEKRLERLSKPNMIDLETYDRELDVVDNQGGPTNKVIDKTSSEYLRAARAAEKLKVKNTGDIKVSKGQAVEILSHNRGHDDFKPMSKYSSAQKPENPGDNN